MRNAIQPNFTQFGMSIGFILGELIQTELVFSYPWLDLWLT